MITKTVTLNCIYKIKTKQINFNEACDELTQFIASILNTEEFDNVLHAITKEVTINVDKKQEPEIELLITLFITTLKAPAKPSILLRKYMEDHLIKIDRDNFSAKIIKRRIY